MFLCETKITKDDLEAVFQEYFKTKAILDKVEAVLISKGVGFMSDVMRVDLTWDCDSGTNDLPLRVIVKAPKMDHANKIVEDIGGDKLDNDFIETAHNLECKAYEILKHGSPLPIPKVYACWPISSGHAGMVVMEDIGEKAGILRNIADGLNLHQWQNIVASLADLHAWSLTTKVPWRQELPTIEGLRKMYDDFITTMTVGLAQVQKNYSEYFGNINEEAVLKELNISAMVEKQVQYRKIMDDVMLHGDTWVNNIMFYKNSDGSLSDKVAAFLDWQISMQGCGINDLTRFDTWCINHDMRRGHYKQMLRFYCDRMKSKAGDKFRPTYEEVESVYKESFRFNGLLMVTLLEGLLNSIVRADEDETGWRKKEILERSRAIYDDVASFAGWC